MTTRPADLAPSAPTEPTASPKPARRPGAAMHTLRMRAATVGLIVAILLVAEVGSRSGLISNLIIPAPTDVWSALLDQWTTEGFWGDVGSTVTAMVVGFVLAAVGSFVVSAVLILVRGLEEITMPIIIAVETMPKIAIAPIIILWLGFGQLGKTVIVGLVTFFPILINTLQGLRVTNRDEYDLLRSLGSTKVQLFRYVRLPRAMPYIFAGLRVGAVFALIGAVVAEFVGSENGLGALIITERSQFNVPGVWALLVDLMIMGIVVYALTSWAERRLLFWSKEQAGA